VKVIRVLSGVLQALLLTLLSARTACPVPTRAVVASGSYHVVIAANADVNRMVGRLDGNWELFQLEGDNAGVLSPYAARTAGLIQLIHQICFRNIIRAKIYVRMW
jgi:hypothetical protein